MPTENAAVHPIEKSAGPLFTLSAAPQAKALVDKKVADGQSKEGVATQTQTYMDRVRKYVPLEVIGFFIFMNAMVGKGENGAAVTGSHAFVAVASVVVSLIAVVIIARMANSKAETQVWFVQASTSCLAFLVWAYAIGAEAVKVIGVFPQDPIIAAFLLATFSLFSGLIVPIKKTDGTAA